MLSNIRPSNDKGCRFEKVYRTIALKDGNAVNSCPPIVSGHRTGQGFILQGRNEEVESYRLFRQEQ